MEKKKRNNGDELQPYDEKTGEYEEMNQTESVKDEVNLLVRLHGGNKEQFPVHFPKKGVHSLEYAKKYLEQEVGWINPEIPPGKIKNYLLSMDNNKPKAEFFRNILGYNETNWESLVHQIMYGAANNPRYIHSINDFGLRVSIVMPILSSSGKKYYIVTGWIVEENQKPRLVTAYPFKKGDKI
ncbi:MAG: hypothetical protein HUJ60_01330 [Bacilli bacterium]|nr:hypothetical protein [Bacilli bacterium]